jgi:NDP-sugar pyrophosphorylase family protein
LRPLTNDRPKALVASGGRTLLETTLERLKAFGILDVIVNVHHFADMIVDYLETNGHFGMRIAVSREEVLLDTGGGLKKAAWFFGTDPDEPFLLHNVDVASTIDLHRMTEFHTRNKPLATLAMQDRQTSRYLLFDQENRLCGKSPSREPQFQSLGFSGISVISPRLFSLMGSEEVFSIVTCYLDAASRGEKILAFHADEYAWKDMGKPENLV